MSIAGVILAAGSGSRFGPPGAKLRAVLKERPLIALAIDPALEAELDEIVVVTGAGADRLCKLVPEGLTVLLNEQWYEGQATSLGVALDWCQHRGHSSAVIGLADIPGLTAEAWRTVAHTAGGPIVVATYAGRRGHPVRVDADVWPLLPTEGEEGARRLMARRPELVTEVACVGTPVDIDTREDLHRWS